MHCHLPVSSMPLYFVQATGHKYNKKRSFWTKMRIILFHFFSGLCTHRGSYETLYVFIVETEKVKISLHVRGKFYMRLAEWKHRGLEKKNSLLPPQATQAFAKWRFFNLNNAADKNERFIFAFFLFKYAAW